MATDKQINIIIDAQNRTSGAVSGAQRSLESFKSSVENMQPTFKKMAVAGTVAFTAIAGIAVSSFKAFADAEAQLNITNQSLSNSLDNLSKGALAQLKKDTGDLRDGWAGLANAATAAGNAAVKLGFDDEVASRSFAKLFAVTKDVTKSQKEVSLAMDLARFKGISLEEATQKLVMVHSGATKELKLLGLAVDDTATAEQNLDSIHKQVADSANTFALTSAGAMEIIKVQIGNIQESIGGALAPAMTKVFEVITPLIEKFSAWAEKNPELLSKIILIGGGLAALVAVMGILGTVLPAVIAGFALLTGPIGLIVIGITALALGIAWVVTHWDLLKEKTMEVFNSLPGFVQEGIKLLLLPLTMLINFIQLIKTNWSSITGFFKDLWASVTAIFRSAVDGIKAILQPIIDTVNNLINKIQSIGGAIGGGVKKAGKAVGDFLGFDTGGVVPGPRGAPQLAMVHGGETILPTHKTGGGGFMGGGINVTINNPTLLDSTMVERMSMELANVLRRDLRV